MLLSSLRVLLQHGRQYIRRLDRVELSEEFRGRPMLQQQGLSARDASALRLLCPTRAIDTKPGLSLDLGRCLFCGECARQFPAYIRFTNDYRICSPTREGLIIRAVAKGFEAELPAAPMEFDQGAVRPEVKKLFGRSLHLRQVSAGGDNSSEMELNAAGNVNFDMRRFGVEFTASPRHADGIVLTGPLTVNMMREVETTLLAVPQPRVIMAVGCDAISGGLFADSPAVDRSFFDKYPIDLYVPGNPAHPMTFIWGVRQLLKPLPPVPKAEPLAQESESEPKSKSLSNTESEE